jgi:hypothetical protein
VAVETQQGLETGAVPDFEVELRSVDHGVESEGTKMRKGGRNTWEKIKKERFPQRLD